MLIAITGSKGSGKDTFASFFTRLNFYNAKMAGPLKAMMRTLYREAGLDEDVIERKIEGDLKETPCDILCGRTPRYAMQTLGTEWGQRMIDKRLWSRMWGTKVHELMRDGVPVVCTDIRFLHEQEEIRALAGHFVRIERPGQESNDTHVSELEMKKLTVDRTIQNDGSIGDLQRKAADYLKEITS